MSPAISRRRSVSWHLIGDISCWSPLVMIGHGSVQPAQQISDDLGAIGLIEHLMAPTRIELQGHLQTGRLERIDQRIQTSQLLVNGILVPGENVNRHTLSCIEECVATTVTYQQ